MDVPRSSQKNVANSRQDTHDISIGPFHSVVVSRKADPITDHMMAWDMLRKTGCARVYTYAHN
ncbi:MAG: hypothetical protein ACREOZ_00995 [Gloeomargaritales cyanobacterium]